MTHPKPSAMVRAQMKGYELPNQSTKVEYQLISKSGRVVMSFDENCAERAMEERDSRRLDLFRVTTLVEKI